MMEMVSSPCVKGLAVFTDEGLCGVQERVTQLRLTVVNFVEDYRCYIRRHCLNKSLTTVSSNDIYFLLLETKVKGQHRLTLNSLCSNMLALNF